MKPAALPGDGGENGAARGSEAGVVVGDEEFEGSETALLEALEKIGPVDFGFAQSDADAEDLAFTLRTDAQDDEHGVGTGMSCAFKLFKYAGSY